MEQISRAGADEALGLMIRRAAWDGYEGDTRYAYGLYVIDKGEASNRLCMTVSDTYDRIKAIEDALLHGGQTQDQVDRMALEAIECIAILGVVKAVGTAVTGGVKPLVSIQEISKLTADPRFDTDPAFRKDVERRIAAGNKQRS